jgi:hypothetical protein
MKAYNEYQALIRAWKLKISGVDSKRQDLKAELLAILDDPVYIPLTRVANFKEKQNALLGVQHEQGWFWDSHFNWLFSLLSPVFSFFNWGNPQPGSRLRMALAEEPVPEKFPMLTLEDYDTCDCLEINEDNTYEEALFSQPGAALCDIKSRLNALIRDTPNVDLQQLLERLYALKYRLDPFLYQHLLEQLYTAHPKETVLFFYKIYQNEQYETPAEQDCVELHMLARTIMDNFVINRQDIHVHNHSELYLFILLSISDKSIYPESEQNQADPVETLLESWDTGFDRFEIIHQDLRKRLNQLLTAEEQTSRRSTQLLSNQENASEGLLQTLKDIFDKFHPRIHPLLGHIARLSLEQLLLDYKKDELTLGENDIHDLNWRAGHHGYDTISFIVTTLIHTGPIKRLGTFEQQQKLLDPTLYAPIFPAEMRTGEKYAIELILAQAMGEYFFQNRARHIRCYSNIPLSDATISWIIIRVAHVAPNLASSLKHILKNIAVYEPASLASLELSHPAQPTSQELIGNFLEHLAAAKEAAKKLDSEGENAAVRNALTAFNHCLSCCTLNSAELEILFNECQSSLYQYYISTDLAQKWRLQIWALQAKITRWCQDDVAGIDAEPASCPLAKAKSCRNNALSSHGTDLSCAFNAESEQSKLAVYYIAQYMKNPGLEKNEEAQNVLDLLKNYLTEDQYTAWNLQLKAQRKSEPSVKGRASEIGFYSESSSSPGAIQLENSKIYGIVPTND